MYRIILTLLLLIVWRSAAFALDMTCETRFVAVIDEAGGVEQVKPAWLKKWLKRMRSEECSFHHLNQYASFQPLVENHADVARLDQIGLVNRANALLMAMHQVVAEQEFYPDFETAMNALPRHISDSSMKNFLFDIHAVNIMGPTLFTALGKQIDVLERYQELCATGQTWECERWDRSIRYFSALTYLSRNISEQKSRYVLTEFRQQVAEEIEIWDRYYNTRKPQLPWEMMANQAIHRDIRTAEYFARPPKWDLVLMHPQLVFTDASGDLSEGEVEAKLMWEVVGANFWDSRLITGVSLMTSSLDDADHLGANLTVKNKFSVGYINDDDGTWYLSVDLYDFFADKKNRFKQKLEDNLKRFESAL